MSVHKITTLTTSVFVHPGKGARPREFSQLKSYGPISGQRGDCISFRSDTDVFRLEPSNTGVTFQGMNPHTQAPPSTHTIHIHRHKSSLLQKGSFRSPLMLERRFDLWPQERAAGVPLMFCQNATLVQTAWPLEAAGQSQSEPSDTFKVSANRTPVWTLLWAGSERRPCSAGPPQVGAMHRKGNSHCG